MQTPSRLFGSVARVIALLSLGVGLLLPGCGKAECDDSKCAAGNKCVDDGHGDTACRLLCDTQGQCPFNYRCTASPSGTTYCGEMTTKYTKKDTGQWGSPCTPTGGIDGNPQCDDSQTFWCYARTPTDGDAYCTQYQCGKDSDCPGDFYCDSVNNAPNALSAKRSYGPDQTTTVCLRREYCSPCESEGQCPSGMKCVPGSADGKKFCTTTCNDSTNCQADADCGDNPTGDGKVCMPRAGTCKGDGSLCAPCRSDADCPNGICAISEYSHERFCTVKSDVPCQSVNNKLVANCPKPNQAGVSETCITSTDFPGIPKDMCVGLVQFGVDNSGNPTPFPACWTKPKKF